MFYFILEKYHCLEQRQRALFQGSEGEKTMRQKIGKMLNNKLVFQSQLYAIRQRKRGMQVKIE